jgi:hypothetical protein
VTDKPPVLAVGVQQFIECLKHQPAGWDLFDFAFARIREPLATAEYRHERR